MTQTTPPSASPASRGYLYPHKKTHDKQPDLRGKLKVEDKELWVSAWVEKQGYKLVFTDPSQLPPKGTQATKEQRAASDIGTGQLARNAKGKDTHPDWKGDATIAGKALSLAGWEQQRGEDTMISLRAEEPRQYQAAAAQPDTTGNTPPSGEASAGTESSGDLGDIFSDLPSL